MNKREIGCAPWAYVLVLAMLSVPVICLSSTIAAAPYAKSIPARSGGDGSFLAVMVVLLIAALFGVAIAKREQFVEYNTTPAAKTADALAMEAAANTNLTTSISMGEVTRDIRRGMAYLEVHNPSPTAPTPLAGPKIAENAPARTVKSGEAGER